MIMARFGQDRQRRILFNWGGSDVLAWADIEVADDVDGSQPGGGEVVHQEFEGIRFHPPPEWLLTGTNTVQVLLLPSDVRPWGQNNDLPPVFVSGR